MSAIRLRSSELNFSGKYTLDASRSDDPTELLKALGVPWGFRVALQRARRTVTIEHDGQEIVETTFASVITKTTTAILDGVPRKEVVRKRLIDGGAVYHIHNTLTVRPDTEYVTNTYFDKVGDQ